MDDRSVRAPDPIPCRWSMVAESLTRPYRVTVPMVVLVLLVPLYLFIPMMVPRRSFHVPALPLDRLVPVRPAWALVYGSLYLFLIVLPVLVVRDEEHIRRTVSAYLTVWVTAYVCFLLYPTVAPRPPEIIGRGFAVSGLQFLYGADPPYNCFPSLHVAHSWVSALASHRVHRGLGKIALLCAALVALSTLFTHQHYVVDVIAGIALATAADFIFLRKFARERISELDRRVAPLLAAGILAAIGLIVVLLWLAYTVRLS